MGHHEPLTILVVEDHAQFLGLISGMLRRRADFRVFEVMDGLEAVQKIEALQPDLVLLDINLPGLNGFQIAERIRGLAPRAAFLFMSQESSAAFVHKALSLGARGYVHKSSAATDLLPAIDAALAASAPRRHEIRFCPDDAAIVDGMTRYFAAALNAGDAALALATPSHHSRVLQALRARGVDVDGAIARGTYVSLDADEAIEPVRFQDAIDHAREAAGKAGKAHARVAFCGERAGRLWAAGRTAEAVQLEQLCGELAHDVDILCIYPVPHREDDQALAHVCAGHTAVFPG